MGDNKVEADRMFDIAARYFEQKNFDKARQFLERADKLHSSKQIRDLLSKLNSSQNSGSAGSSKSPGGAATSSNKSSGSSKVPGGASSTNSHNHNGTSEAADTDTRPDYTAEQLNEVQRIRRCRDYYEILNVEKTATDDDVKRAYRKLAMKLHPDKNKAPGATEAFRGVSNAFAVLSDAQKRRQYDVIGPNNHDHSTMRDGPTANARGSARRRYTRDGEYFYEYDFSRGFESEMNAEDIFNMFFGGGLFTAAEDHNGEHPAQHRERVFRARTEGSSYLMWLQIAPFIALILLSLLSSVFRSDPPFSLSHTGRFTEARETSNLRVKYFVKNDFDEHYGDRIGVVELDVENEYYNTIRSKCYNEQAYRESVMYRARLYGDGSAFNQARNMALPSCDELSRISKFF